MDIKFIESTKNRLKVELASQHHTLPNAISKELWNDKDVTIAGYTLEHPSSSAVLVIETKSESPKKALLGAISRLQKKNKEFLAAVKTLK